MFKFKYNIKEIDNVWRVVRSDGLIWKKLYKSKKTAESSLLRTIRGNTSNYYKSKHYQDYKFKLKQARQIAGDLE